MTDDRKHRPGSGAEGWEKHNLSQLRHFRSLTLRQKMEAVEGMADVVRRFEEMRRKGGFTTAARKAEPPAVAADREAREPTTEYNRETDGKKSQD